MSGGTELTYLDRTLYGGMRILWLKSGPLHPLDTGGKLRTYHMLRELNRRHPITYLSLNAGDARDEDLAAATEYSTEQQWLPFTEAKKSSLPFFAQIAQNFLSPLPYAVAKYRSPAMTAAMAQLLGQHDLLICDFLVPAINLLAAPSWPSVPTLLFQHNVESQIWQRHAENARGRLGRWYFRQQWQRMVRYERETAARFDGVITVSEADAEIHRRDFSLTNVLGAVPTGVDTEFFAARPRQARPRQLVFLGSMDWMPNIDGAVWFAEEIWPHIVSQFPDAECAIVGRNPTTRVRELAAQDPRLRITGTVDDVRPYLAEAALMIVPLRIGGGTRIKIYEGMAAGCPVVSTTVGAEGLPLTSGEHIERADTPADFARVVNELLADDARRESLALRGQEHVCRHFGWGAAVDTFETYCHAAIERRHS
jgi:polysaccharide biosynthesis protein PslH